MEGKEKSFGWLWTTAAVLLVAALLFGWLLTGRRDGEPTRVEVLIGLSEHDLNEPWCRQRVEQLKKGLEDREEIRLIVLNAAHSLAKQQQDIQNLMEYGIDLLLVSPGDPQYLNQVIDQAYEQVPVVVLDNPITADSYTMFIGPDNREAGRMVGQKLLESIPEGERKQVAELKGVYTSPTARLRHEGFLEAVEDSDKVVLRESFCADWLTEYAQDKTQALLGRSPELEVFVCQGTAMAYGVFRALDRLGMENEGMILSVADDPDDQVGCNMTDFAMVAGTVVWQPMEKPLYQYLLQLLEEEKKGRGKAEQTLPREIWLQPDWYGPQKAG